MSKEHKEWKKRWNRTVNNLPPDVVNALHDLSFSWLVLRVCRRHGLPLSKDKAEERDEYRNKIRLIMRGFVKARYPMSGEKLRKLIRLGADDIEKHGP